MLCTCFWSTAVRALTICLVCAVFAIACSDTDQRIVNNPPDGVGDPSAAVNYPAVIITDVEKIATINQPHSFRAASVDANLGLAPEDRPGAITLYEWDFDGDGVFDYSSTSTVDTTHTYTKYGPKNALVRVTDNDGNTRSDTTLVVVVEYDLSAVELERTIYHSGGAAQYLTASGINTSDGGRLVTGWLEGILVVSDFSDGSLIRRIDTIELGEPAGLITAVAVSPDGQHIVSGSYSSTIRAWHMSDGSHDVDFVTDDPDSSMVSSLVFSPDGQYVFATHYGSVARMFRADDGSLVRTIPADGDVANGESVGVLAVDPVEDTYIYTEEQSNEIRIHRIPDGALIRTIGGAANSVWSLGVFPDGKHVIAGLTERRARVWSLTDGELVHDLAAPYPRNQIRPPMAPDLTWSVAVSPDGQYVIGSWSQDGVGIWLAADGSLVRVLDDVEGRIVSVTPEGNRVVIIYPGGKAEIWAVPDRD
jgi:WD40 repeat protein